MPDPEKKPDTSTQTGAPPEATGAETSPETADSSPSTADETLHEQPDQHDKDLADFNKDFLEAKKKGAPALEEFSKLDKSGDFTSMRRGGVEQTDDQNDTLKKHSRLSSAFLEKEQAEGKKTYRVDFKENSTAERYVGAGDILPPNVEAIMVKDDNGNVVSARAVRNINARNRIGYYDTATGKYVSIHSGYSIIVLSTRTDTSRKLAQENEQSFRADTTLARRKLAEHVSLFQRPQNTDSEDLQVGLDNKPPASATQEEIAKNELPPPPEGVEPARKEVVTADRLKNMGYKRLTKATPKITREAVNCLKKGGDIGTTHFMEIDGKKYALRREMHKHAPNECPPLPARLCAPHPGISVFAA